MKKAIIEERESAFGLPYVCRIWHVSGCNEAFHGEENHCETMAQALAYAAMKGAEDARENLEASCR